MIISESEKNRIKKLHKKYFTLKEHALGGMASVGSGFVNPQGGTGRVGQFLARQAELGEDCGGSHDPMEDNVIQRFEEPPMEENLAGRFYNFGEEELQEVGPLVPLAAASLWAARDRDSKCYKCYKNVGKQIGHEFDDNLVNQLMEKGTDTTVGDLLTAAAVPGDMLITAVSGVMVCGVKCFAEEARNIDKGIKSISQGAKDLARKAADRLKSKGVEFYEDGVNVTKNVGSAISKAAQNWWNQFD